MTDNRYSVLETSMIDDDGTDTYRFDREQHARILLDNLNNMQVSEGKSKPLLTDISVCGSDKVVVPFHSVVLAACSSTIQDTLASESFAKYANGEFVIHDVTSAGVNVLRDFAYGCDVTVTGDNVDEARKLATLYTIDDLESVCESYEEEAAGESKASEVEHSFEDQASNILDAIKEMWQEEQLTDVVLQDEDQETELYCHKSCLAAASSQFRDMLQSKRIKRRGAIPIKGLSTNALSSLIGYIYTAEVTIDSENVEQLFINSCYFHLPDIVKAACDWLERILTHENAIGILELAQSVQSDQECVQGLQETAFNFIVEHFGDIVERSDEFVTMSLDNLTKVISENELVVESEEQLFHAVMKWVKHDEKRRLVSLPQLLKCVRLGNTTDDFLELVEQDPLIQKSPACFDTIEAARTAVNNSPTTKGARSVDNSCILESLSAFDDNQSVASTRTSSSVGKDLQEQQYWEREGPGDYIDDEKQAETNRQSVICNNRTPDRHTDRSAAVARKLVFSENNASDENPRRKDGQLDMRFKVNRNKFLGQALNKDGSLDERTRVCKNFVASMKPTSSETKPRVNDPLTKSGKPDRRFSINKKIFEQGLVSQRTSSSTAPGRLKKDGTPDMRFATHKAAVRPHASPAATHNSFAGRALSGPLKKDRTPDMRYAANKTSLGSSYSVLSPQVPSNSTYSSGPLKKNGTPDMRYAANKIFSSSSSSRSRGYSSHGASSFTPSGPLKKDGTPDMRYKANKR